MCRVGGLLSGDPLPLSPTYDSAMGAFADEIIYLGSQLVSRAASDQVCLVLSTPSPCR